MLYALAFLYLLIPAFIFIIGWIQPLLALLLCALLAISFFKYIRNNSAAKQIDFHNNLKKVFVVLLLLLFWVLFSGIGGFIWQNFWDHKFRNAVFMDLVKYEWPVIQKDYALCYYLGFWLPAALVGKVFGLELGYMFQVFWAYIGVVLAIFLLFNHLGKISISAVLLFIFFSGLDVFIYFARPVLYRKDLLDYVLALFSGAHIELEATYFNSSSNTTLLFWLYNQIIPFWVGFLLILRQQNKLLILNYALLFLYAPFPCVTLFPLVVFLFIRNFTTQKRSCLFKSFIKEACTLENICAVLFVCIVGLYYMSNISTGKISFLGFNPATILLFFLSFLCEYAFYLLFIYKDHKQDPILWILMIATIACSFIVLGDSYDFAWRTCIPFSFYLMLTVADKINSTQVKKRTCLLLVTVLLIGAVTPCTEMIRTALGEWSVLTNHVSARSDSLDSVFTRENNECYENFIGSTDNIFFQHLSKGCRGIK